MWSWYTFSKMLHLWFVVSWFAGLFYLPRILVNIALVDQGQTPSPAERQRLLLMADKLQRFMIPLAVLTVVTGSVLAFMIGWKQAWLHGKITLVALLVIYHYASARLLKTCHHQPCPRSDHWLRWFNEIPVLLLLAVLALVLFKPWQH